MSIIIIIFNFSLGWLKWYEFSDVDFMSAVKLAEDVWIRSNKQIQWNFLIGLFYNAVYGGRIDSLVDLKVLKAYLEMYFEDEVLSHRWKPLNLQTSLPTSANYQVKIVYVFQHFILNKMHIFCRNTFVVFRC